MNTLEKALQILFVLKEANTTLSVRNIATRVGIPESTTYRLVKTLENNGMIDKNSSGEVGLGITILDLARTIYKQLDEDLLILARPLVEELTEKINETSLLVVRRGNICVTVEHMEGTRLIGFVEKNGRIHPLHLGASGKAILAFESERIIKNVIKNLNINKEKVLNDLKSIRERGYAKTVGEVDKETIGIAAPIFDISNQVIASLTIIGPASRFNADDIGVAIKEVVHTAQKITDKINYRVS